MIPTELPKAPDNASQNAARNRVGARAAPAIAAPVPTMTRQPVSPSRRIGMLPTRTPPISAPIPRAPKRMPIPESSAPKESLASAGWATKVAPKKPKQ